MLTLKVSGAKDTDLTNSYDSLAQGEALACWQCAVRQTFTGIPVFDGWEENVEFHHADVSVETLYTRGEVASTRVADREPVLVASDGPVDTGDQRLVVSVYSRPET